MKKIHCDFDGEDFLKISPFNSSDIFLDVNQEGKRSRIRIGADKIRKLRKQLKRVLVEIEGEEVDYKPGDSVYLAEGDDEGDDYCKSPSVSSINLSIPVKLTKRLGSGEWELIYTMENGDETVGFAYEKSFGRRA